MNNKKVQLRHRDWRLVNQAAFLSALLALAALFAYWPVLHCDFLNYDDDGYVTANAHVQHGLAQENIAWGFRTFETANWHPLTWLSLMLDAQLFGQNAGGFHFVNTLLHAANSALLFLLLQKITGAQWRSAFVAALFALHPLHVESVAWVSERKDVLSGFFFFLTLLAYVRFASLSKAQNLKAKFFYALALSAFVCGLMSKPMLVTLPFVLLLLDFWPLNRIQNSQFEIRNCSKLFVEKIPFLILSAISCAVTFIAQKKGEAVQSLAAFPFSARIGNASVSCITYLEKTFWPSRLAVFYPYSNHLPLTEILLAAMLIASVSIAAFVLARKFPFLFVGWFWFLGMLVPVIGLIQVGQQAMADRYTYLPLVGIFLVFVWGVSEIWNRFHFPKTPLIAGTILIFAVCAALTRKQISYWQNSETLFQRAIAVTKNNAEAWEHLGTFYLRSENRTTDAQNCFQRSVDINPSRISAHINLGSVFILEGNPDNAVEQFNAVLKLSPNNADANCDLGYISASRGQFDGAIAHYNRAIETKPDFASAFHNRGLAFASENNWTNAIRDYQTAIGLEPNHASTHKHLGIALVHINQTNEAAKEFNTALQLNPNDAEAAQQLQLLQK